MRSQRLPLKVLGSLSVVLCILFLSRIVSAQETRVITFDAPGADTKPGDNNGTYPGGINAWGAVTGNYVDANNVLHGFLRSPEGKFTTFEAPGADTTPGSYNGTYPTAINDWGAITGIYYDATGLSHGFLRSPDGKFTTFDVKGAGANGTFPVGLNLEGAVVGYALDANLLFHAFLRTSEGKIFAFVGPDSCDTGIPTGCYGNEATAINIWGTSVGNFMDNSGNFVGHELIRDAEGKLTTFDAPGAGIGTDQGTGCPGCTSGLNQWGAIAGTYTDSNNVHHGFLRSPSGEFTTFDAPGAGTGSYEGTGCFSDCPTSLNNSGAITGLYLDSNFVLHGYLRSPDGNIVTIDPPGSVAAWSSGMNDWGTITGYYLDPNGVTHGFLRIPREE